MKYMMIERINHYYCRHGNYDIFERALERWRASKSPRQAKYWYRVLDTLLKNAGF